MFNKLKAIVLGPIKKFSGLASLRYLRWLGKKGDNEALYRLGCLYEKGNTAVMRNQDAAYAIFRFVAKKGHKLAGQKATSIERLMEATLPPETAQSIKENADYIAKNFAWED